MQVTLGPHDPAHPYFLYFFSGVGVSLSLLINRGAGGLFPPGEPATEEGHMEGPNFCLQFNQVQVRGFLQDRFWVLVLLGFLWGSGGFHNQGLYIRRIREFVNKRF